jgi:hypothetical protein
MDIGLVAIIITAIVCGTILIAVLAESICYYLDRQKNN